MAISTILKSVFGSRNQRLLKRYRKVVTKINDLEQAMRTLSDASLRAKTLEFKERLANGQETLDHLLPEAFAVVREVSIRTLGMRPFDVQLIGGMVLHDGKIAEMSTGEGKTLVATLPAYLNALSGKGVHIITVNDYLAKRDAEWMEPIFNFLQMTVGVNLPLMNHAEKKAAFAADITYGTNNEYGFDYLRDNMAFENDAKVQRGLNFAIVDEVDSILIDEARTPLIISGPAEDSSELYIKIDKIIPKLQKQKSDTEPGDYFLDEKNRQAYLTEQGHEKIEQLMIDAGLLQEGDSLYAPVNITLMHHVSSALRAHTIFKRDVDYIVRDREIIIVDEHTGRTLPGRRWSEGLHQAIEAKEHARIQNENQTLATITFQNYFRLYGRLSGMTGTADTEAYEFHQIYGLEVVVIPTNVPNQRLDQPDHIYLTKAEKFNAVIKDIEACLAKKRPVLVGTASIETSEFLSNLLNKHKIPHQVLNAKFHQKEAEIIAEAGHAGTVTIATNMAGRGTDIVLGGNPEAIIAKMTDITPQQKDDYRKKWLETHKAVVNAGGLHVIGSERHESRRIDNQLRGRCGRQGDPGSTRFYLSLEDDLMRIFAGDRVAGLIRKLGLPENEPIEHPWVSRAIENAQRKVEGHNFDIRKELLEFDDVANAQRKVIYAQRADIMSSLHVHEVIAVLRQDVINELIANFIPPDSLEELWDVAGLEKEIRSEFGFELPIQKWLVEDQSLNEESLSEKILQIFNEEYVKKELQTGDAVLRQFEKAVLLQTLDSHWKDHLAAMDHLRQGIYLRGYAQKNPKQEYKREAFILFSDMLNSLKHEVLSVVTKAKVQAQEQVDEMEEKMRAANARLPMNFTHAEVLEFAPNAVEADGSLTANRDTVEAGGVVQYVRDEPKVGRNDICPCGSGKKYKHCHGKM